MASKEESPAASSGVEHTSPKKRRKVNHGKVTSFAYPPVNVLIQCMSSMHLLSALGEPFSFYCLVAGDFCPACSQARS